MEEGSFKEGFFFDLNRGASRKEDVSRLSDFPEVCPRHVREVF